MRKSYNETSIDDILIYARRLEGSTINDANQKFGTNEGGIVVESDDLSFDGKEYRGKGSFGQALEEIYFGKQNDNVSEPDFSEAKLELKASPLKYIKNNTIRVKERLVLNHFRYEEMDKEVFETSHFLIKNAVILLVFYFYSKNQKPESQKVDLVDIWRCLDEDMVQIQEDWETIVQKIHDGKAETISEGDTMYLGACTKGATKATNYQKQPHSDVLAQSRALCFKQSYMNMIYNKLKHRQIARIEKKDEPIKERYFLSGSETNFNCKVLELFAPYLGKPCLDITNSLSLKSDGKAKFALIARHILGFKKKSDSFYEFDAANVQVKTIRVEVNGKIKESMSFKPIVYNDIINQEWEDSDFYQELISKFIFVIFRRIDNSSDYYLSDVKIWNMPESDLQIVQNVWNSAKKDIGIDNFSNLPKLSDHLIAHVRPHGRNSQDKMVTPSGRYEYKRSFWLNKQYIEEVIVNGKSYSTLNIPRVEHTRSALEHRHSVQGTEGK